MRETERIGAMGNGGSTDSRRRVDEGWRIAEVGHHVNCIPDCGLLKSGALYRVSHPPIPLFNPDADPKLDLTSQRPQARFGLQQGHHLWGLQAATASELSLVCPDCKPAR